RVGRTARPGVEPATYPDEVTCLQSTARDPGGSSLSGRENAPAELGGKWTAAAWHEGSLPERGDHGARPPHRLRGRRRKPGQKTGSILHRPAATASTLPPRPHRPSRQTGPAHPSTACPTKIETWRGVPS